MKTKEITFEFTWTYPVAQYEVIKTTYAKTVMLEPGDDEEEVRTQVADEVIEYVQDKTMEVYEARDNG